MTYQPFPVSGFGGGLILRAQPDILDPSQAVDLLNVVFTERGAVKQRAGFAKLSTTALTNQGDSILPYITSAGTKRLVVGNGDRLDVFDTFPGATAANSTAPTANPHFMTRFGGPANEAVYISNGTDQIRRLLGTTFSTPAGLSGQTGKFVAVWQNRLVCARESGTTAGNNPSSVTFSAPGLPEDFTSIVYEDLHPGDGEAIQGMAVWRELLFVFKESKFFVFDGIGADATGAADPNWRAVEAGVGLAAANGVVAARDGVYFLDRKGVYRTTGADPVQVSDQLDPFFLGDASPFFRSNSLNKSSIGKAAMGFHEEKLYLAVPTGASTHNDRLLVYDPRFQWWSLHDMPVAAMCVFRPGSDEELVFAASGATLPNNVGKHVCRHSPSYEADNMETDGTDGAAITSRWRSGWLDHGMTQAHRSREQKFWGEGVCSAKVTVDFGAVGTTSVLTFGNASPDLWSTDPLDVWSTDPLDVWGGEDQITERIRRIASRGTKFSIEFSNSTINTSWGVHQMVWHLDGQRIPSVLSTEAA